MNVDVRPAAVAGTFYPQDAAALASDVDTMMRSACTARTRIAQPKALVVPHAGYVYSGPIAATAYATITQPETITRVVLLGPSHRVYLQGVAAPSAARLRTPLGDIEVDHGALAAAHVPRNDEAHAQEHSLEVQLPFLQRLVPHARVCPIVCGRASPDEVATVIDALWGGPETLVIVSSDLSHYLPYTEGRAADEQTARKVVALETDLTGDDACGFVGLRGLLVVARRKGLTCKLLDLRSSGDTAGKMRSEVVGYGAFALGS
jgi:AmmeMemoRadiSam system protein B